MELSGNWLYLGLYPVTWHPGVAHASPASGGIACLPVPSTASRGANWTGGSNQSLSSDAAVEPLLWLTYAGILPLGPLRVFERVCLVLLEAIGLSLRMLLWQSSAPIELLNMLLLLPLFTIWYGWVRKPTQPANT